MLGIESFDSVLRPLWKGTRQVSQELLQYLSENILMYGVFSTVARLWLPS